LFPGRPVPESEVEIAEGGCATHAACRRATAGLASAGHTEKHRRSDAEDRCAGAHSGLRGKLGGQLAEVPRRQ